MKAAVTCVSVLVAGALFAPAAGAQISDLEILTQGAGREQAQFETELVGLSPDLARIYFETDGSLTPDDEDDNRVDVYESTGAATRLISTGPADPHDDRPGFFNQAATDGSRVFFSAGGTLVDADTDDADDVYARIGDETVLLSLEPLGVLAGQTNFEGATADGSRAWFGTDAPLLPEDQDETHDVYEFTGVEGDLELVSTGPEDGEDTVGTSFEDSTPDGSQVFFSSRSALTDDDTDDGWDISKRVGDETTLVTPDPAVDDGAFAEMGVLDVSADGSRVYLATSEGLAAGDEDGLWDYSPTPSRAATAGTASRATRASTGSRAAAATTSSSPPPGSRRPSGAAPAGATASSPIPRTGCAGASASGASRRRRSAARGRAVFAPLPGTVLGQADLEEGEGDRDRRRDGDERGADDVDDGPRAGDHDHDADHEQDDRRQPAGMDA